MMVSDVVPTLYFQVNVIWMIPRDPCPVSVTPGLNVGCKYFSIPSLFDIIEADVEKKRSVYTCKDETVSAEYKLSLPGPLGDLTASGPKVRDLDIPGVELVCNILNFELNVGFKIFGKRFDLIKWKPFGDIGRRMR